MAEEADDLALLLEAASAAASIATGFFGRKPEVWWKEGNSPVSEADLAVDRFLRTELLAARPSYGWVSEETATHPGGSDRFFIVDPIDGTRAFLRGESTWCVALAVVEAGRPVAAVIDAPAIGEVFAARADAAPTLNGRPLSVSPERPAGNRLRLSIPDAIRRRLPATELTRLDLAPSIPSLALRLAMVAAGRLDGTLIRPRANDWDIVAGDLILRQAGGRLTDAVGEDRLYKLEAKRHGVLIVGANHALGRLQQLAAAAEVP